MWAGNTTETVTWDVANTDGAIVNCQRVNIRLSTDGGLTYPITLLANTPNDGSAFVTVPNALTNDARVRIDAADNIFFDISNTDFIIGAPIVCNANTPVGLTASNVGSSTATLDWEALANVAFDIFPCKSFVALSLRL